MAPPMNAESNIVRENRGRKCAAKKQQPGSAHDRRHIMTPPGCTGISHRDMQTSAPFVRSGKYIPKSDISRPLMAAQDKFD